MITIKIISWEREMVHSYWYKPQPEEELLLHHLGQKGVDGDESGGTSRPGRVPEHELPGPPKIFGDGGGDQNRFWKN